MHLKKASQMLPKFHFPHSPIIYGNWVETYGPYSHDIRGFLHIYLNNRGNGCQTIIEQW